MRLAWSTLSTRWLGLLLATQIVVACTSATQPTPVPTATPEPWTAVSRSGFSLSLPPSWRVIDSKSLNFAADYRALTTENPDFAKFAPLEGLQQLAAADVVAFDFTAGRSSPTLFTMLIVTTETLASEQGSQTTRNYLYQLRGATNFTTTNMRVGNADGKRVSLDYPVKRSPDEVLRDLPPAPDAAMLREVSFVAYPPARGVIRLTFISRLELADAYGSEFQAIADRFLAN